MKFNKTVETEQKNTLNLLKINIDKYLKCIIIRSVWNFQLVKKFLSLGEKPKLPEQNKNI